MQKTANGAAAKRTCEVHAIGTNLRGWAVGEHHPHARHPDSLVAEVRAMRAAGMSYPAIARATGVHFATVGDWCRGRRRATPPARFIARPVRATGSAAADQQSARHRVGSTTCSDVRNSLRDGDAELLEQLQEEGLL